MSEEDLMKQIHEYLHSGGRDKDGLDRLRSNETLMTSIHNIASVATIDLRRQLAQTLDYLETLLTRSADEYEVYGDRVDVSAFGEIMQVLPTESNSEVDPSTPEQRCLICLERFSGYDHRPIRLDCCKHDAICAVSCLDRWLNDSALQHANKCVLCRNVICEGRPRRPILTDAQRQQETQLRTRVDSLVGQLIDVNNYFRLIYGSPDDRRRINNTLDLLNEELRNRNIFFELSVSDLDIVANAEDSQRLDRTWTVTMERRQRDVQQVAEQGSDESEDADRYWAIYDPNLVLSPAARAAYAEHWSLYDPQNRMSAEERNAVEAEVDADVRGYIQRVRVFEAHEYSVDASQALQDRNSQESYVERFEREYYDEVETSFDEDEHRQMLAEQKDRAMDEEQLDEIREPPQTDMNASNLSSSKGPSL